MDPRSWIGCGLSIGAKRPGWHYRKYAKSWPSTTAARRRAHTSGQLLSTRIDEVRAQIAELIALEGHLQTLLDHASYGPPTEHDHSTVCWILESDLDEPTAIEVSDIHA